METKYKYIEKTDEIEKEVTEVKKVNIPYKQFENELETLTVERDALQVRIDELKAIIKLK